MNGRSVVGVIIWHAAGDEARSAAHSLCGVLRDELEVLYEEHEHAYGVIVRFLGTDASEDHEGGVVGFRHELTVVDTAVTEANG